MPRSSRAPAKGSAFDLVIFDCDGVLVDSEVIACRVVAESLRDVGHIISAESVGDRFAGLRTNDIYAILEAEMGRPLPATFDADLKRRAVELFERELCAISGIETMLPLLATAKCVASSSGPDNLAYKLRLTGLLGWFEPAVFSTALVAKGKPAPDIFLYAAAQMGAEPARCLVVEDSAPGITGAKAAGMTAFGFVGGSHCRSGHDARLSAAGADLVFADMRELPKLMAQRKATLTTS